MRSAFYVLLLFAVAVAGLAITGFCIDMFEPVTHNTRAPLRVVVIPRGATVPSIASELKQQGLIRSAHCFVLWCRLRRLGGKMVAGIYEISPAMPPQQIADMIALGNQATDFVTIPEGFTVRQIADRLAAKGIVDESQFLNLATTKGKSFATPQFQPPSNDLEGYLFPDTYRIPPGTTSQQIIAEMLDNFTIKMNKESPGLAKRPKDLARVVNLASLVEREAQVDGDRPLIAGVLSNRLRVNMPLECDAAIEYALPEHKQRLDYADLRVESPYNTYLHRGLPPTPIANPGLACLRAALHPASTKALYYVAGPGGKSLFSATLQQHDRVVAALKSGNVAGAKKIALEN